VHAGAIGVEDSHHLDFQLVLAVVVRVLELLQLQQQLHIEAVQVVRAILLASLL
jgi:hypothetical protein